MFGRQGLLVSFDRSLTFDYWKSTEDNLQHIINEIDYIMIKQRYRNVRDAKTYQDADVSSDHVLLVAEIKGQIQKK